MMAIGVDFSCNEEKQTQKSRFGKKVITGGLNSRAWTPGVCVADTRDGRGPTDATYWRLATLGYLKPSEHRDDFAIHGRLRQQTSCLPI